VMRSHAECFRVMLTGLAAALLTFLCYWAVPAPHYLAKGIALPLFSSQQIIPPAEIPVIREFRQQHGFVTKARVTLQWHHAWSVATQRELAEKARWMASRVGANAFVIDKLYIPSATASELSPLEGVRVEGRAILIDQSTL